MKTVAQLIDDLLYTHRKPDGREYTYKEIAEALGGRVEPSHLSKLRTGKITNPGRETLLDLCRFFQIPPSYFFPELDALPKPVAAPTADEAIQVALRSSGLRPDVQTKLEELIRALKQEE